MNNESFNTNSAFEDLITKLLPDLILRRQLLQTLAASINEAHSLNPAGWSLTAGKFVNLNVGRMVAFRIHPNSIVVALLRPNLNYLSEKAAIEALSSDEFVSLPGVNLYRCSHSDLLLLWEDVRESHSQAIRSASKGVKRTPYFMPHSLELLETVSEQLGVALPRPQYDEAPITWPQKERLLKLARNWYPGGEGFEDPTFVSDEITYKKVTICRAE